MIKLIDIESKLKASGKYWIAFAGDSITSGEWVHPNWREIVEYVLKDKFNNDWGLKTFNLAYDGSTSKDILSRKDELKSIPSDLVILLTGANDPFQKISPEDFKSNLVKLKKFIEESGSELVLSSDNYPMNEWVAEMCRLYVESMKEVDMNFINLFEISKKFPMDRIYTFTSEMDIPEEKIEKGKADFWHPNQLGNAYIAKVILKEVFDIEFDPEKYWKDTLSGEKLPSY